VTQARVPLFRTLVKPLQQFLQLEASSGILLLCSALAAILWANLHAESYAAFVGYGLTLGAGEQTWHFTLQTLVNDALMTVFFFVVGMEIKRELVAGELNSTAKASLPAIAALGGMLVPAGIYVILNRGGPGAGGWGIPMATDIAFCVGILTLLKTRVPRALTVFLTALAIFDDIGGILVIALFYGSGVHATWLLIAAGIAVALFLLGRKAFTNGWAWSVGGAALWYALHHGGIHATISGVITGLMIPMRTLSSPSEVIRQLGEHVRSLASQSESVDGSHIVAIEERLEELESPLDRFIHALHGLVAFGVMPLFALVNSGVSVRGLSLGSALTPVAVGIAVGLWVGKTVGIFTFTAIAVRLGVSPMPRGGSFPKLLGISVLAGIGFTVALFIAALAFSADAALLSQAKLGILCGSLAAGVSGSLLLVLTRKLGPDVDPAD
jgi:Na+:H+ antiporter, NhaA family